MAENRYGGRRGGSSIFSDDQEPSRRGRRGEERGFLERAGDEVRSWLGDEEAERRRERDMRRDESRSAFGGGERGWRGGAYSGRTPYRGYGASDYGGCAGFDRGQGGYGRSEYGGRSGFVGRSQWDDNYRRWRDRQIEQFDREYEEYRRERQQRFDQDFDSWRRSRLTEGGVVGAGTPATGAIPNAGAISTGAGTASTRASPGSSGGAGTKPAAGSDAGAPTRGRAGRTRTRG